MAKEKGKVNFDGKMLNVATEGSFPGPDGQGRSADTSSSEMHQEARDKPLITPWPSSILSPRIHHQSHLGFVLGIFQVFKSPFEISSHNATDCIYQLREWSASK